MATQLDLQEQEQLDALKAFWNKQGNLITWVLVVALALFAGYTGWTRWQAEQAQRAAALFEELDRAAQTGDADRTGRVFADLKERYPNTAQAQQGALLTARVQFDKGQGDAARATLTWVAENAVENEMRAIARLRLAAVQADAKQFPEALKTLDAISVEGFEGLVADRRGDILNAQGKTAEARAAWQAAYKAMDDKLDYRKLVESKLTAIGAAPDMPATAAAPATAMAAASAAVATAAASGASK